MVNIFLTTGPLLNKNRQQTRRVLLQETLYVIGEQLETLPLKYVRRLSKETDVSKSPVHAATKAFRCSHTDLLLCKTLSKQTVRRAYGFVTGSVKPCVVVK
jgi:hypothetical protein